MSCGLENLSLAHEAWIPTVCVSLSTSKVVFFGQEAQVSQSRYQIDVCLGSLLAAWPPRWMHLSSAYLNINTNMRGVPTKSPTCLPPAQMPCLTCATSILHRIPYKQCASFCKSQAPYPVSSPLTVRLVSAPWTLAPCFIPFGCPCSWPPTNRALST